MTPEKKRTVLITTLTASAFVVLATYWVPDLYYRATGVFLGLCLLRVFFYAYWGWCLILFLAGYTIRELRQWKSKTKYVKVLVLIAIVIEFVLALIWMYESTWGFLVFFTGNSIAINNHTSLLGGICF